MAHNVPISVSLLGFFLIIIVQPQFYVDIKVGSYCDSVFDKRQVGVPEFLNLIIKTTFCKNLNLSILVGHLSKKI